VTFEYVMLDGINDSDAHARALARLLRNVPAKVNLIPFNPFRTPATSAVRRNASNAFSRSLSMRVGDHHPQDRGDDIDAAVVNCGTIPGSHAASLRNIGVDVQDVAS